MIETVKEEKKIRNAYPDRLTVDPTGLEKIGKLLGQLHSTIPACDATRKDMLNWMIEKFQEELSPSDLKELSERFYDEEKFLKLALEEVRAAKARGEKPVLQEILQRKPQNSTHRPIRRKKINVESKENYTTNDPTSLSSSS